MTREQLKEKLELLLRSKDTIGELHFLIEKKGQLEIKKGDVEGTLQETLSNEFLNYAINYFSNENLEIMKLSEADERKDVLYLYDYEEPIDDFEYIKTVRENDSYEEYNFKKDDISNIKGYLVTYVNENIKLTVYKQHYAIFVLKKDSNLLLKLTNSNMINELDGDIFRLNSSFDFIIFDDDIYIKEVEKLEKHYRFHEIVKSNALSGIKKIEALDIIEDISELENMVDDISFSRKLIRASTRSPVLEEVSKENILKFITDYSEGYLAEKVKLNESGDALVLNTKKSKEIFLKILNDDYLMSELTEYNYISSAKDDVNR